MPSPTITEREGGLRRGLSKAQIVMIGLGGAIGTGLFMGSGIAIGYAGPAVVLSYAIAGFVAVVMVFSLSEMAVVHPTAEFLRYLRGDVLEPVGGLRSPLYVLDRAGHRHRRGVGRSRTLHDLLVPRDSGVGMVNQFLSDSSLFQFALGQPLLFS